MRHVRYNSGFNLVEAAIVLGVVGLVIGDIWVAAASVSREMYRTEMKTAIQNANQRMAIVWKDVPFVDNGSHYIVVTPTLYPSGELVAESTLPTFERGYFFGPQVYKSQSGFLLEYFASLGSGHNTMTFRFGPMDRADCNWFGRVFTTVMPGNGGYEASGMGQMGVDNTAGSYLYNFGFDGYNLGTPMINFLNTNCLPGKVNYIGARIGRP